MVTLLQIGRNAASALRLLLILTFVFFQAPLHAAVVVPPRPENYLLDQGAIFPPDVAQRLEDALKVCARDYDAHIYVVTVPSFKVMPSRIGEKLNELLNATRADWLKEKVGAVIIFDDEAGMAAMGESDKAREIFSPLALNMVFKDPRLQSKKKRSAPEKLAGAVSALIQHFTDLRVKANDEARKRRTINLVFASIGGVVIAGGAGLFLMKRREKKAAALKPKQRMHLQH